MKNWIWWMIGGVILIVGGVVALANPFAATFAAEQIAGWIFLLAGIVWLVSTFQAEGMGSKIWSFLAGAALTWLGISLLANPLAGIVSLTVMVALIFLATGVLKVLISFAARGTPFFWVLMISGLVSVLLAILVFANFPESAAVLLGLLLAIELLSDGVSMVALALMRKAATAK